jgi:hypothetical protein
LNSEEHGNDEPQHEEERSVPPEENVYDARRAKKPGTSDTSSTAAWVKPDADESEAPKPADDGGEDREKRANCEWYVDAELGGGEKEREQQKEGSERGATEHPAVRPEAERSRLEECGRRHAA